MQECETGFAHALPTFGGQMQLLLASFLLLVPPASANDSLAEIGAGGIVLARSNAVSIEREDLFVSRERIDVSYVFLNHGGEDVESVVAFPMPDVWSDPDGITAWPAEAGANFLEFGVTVDGEPREPRLEQRALAAGIDVTDELIANGVPLYPFGEQAAAALARLTAETIRDWISRGIVFVENDAPSSGADFVDRVLPFWVLRSTYWWRMTFPAGRPVTVEHDYRPLVGASVGANFLGPGPGSDWDEAYVRRYCIDDAFRRAVLETIEKTDKLGPSFSEERVSYVLNTGSNWSGPIGTFRLTVDKGSTDALVSFCGEGVERVGPTTFRITSNDFVPTRDLHFLFLEPFDRAAVAGARESMFAERATAGTPERGVTAEDEARTREAMRAGPNFAEHYTIARIDCGVGCLKIMIGDNATGEIAAFPYESDDRAYLDLEYAPKSNLIRLFVRDTTVNTCATETLSWDGTRLRLLDAVPLYNFRAACPPEPATPEGSQ